MSKKNIFSQYEVKLINQKEAKEFIVQYHYSHTFPAACASLGAYLNNDLIGVIVFGLSAQPRMAQSIVPYLTQHDYYELQRLFVKDCTECNFESWFIAKSINWLKINKPQIKMLVSFSDPHFNHVGTVYQATNWLFCGKTAKTTAYLKPNGLLVHNRTISKGQIDRTTLIKESRPPKNRYVLFLTKGIDVYKNCLDNTYIRIDDLDYWLNKEKDDNVQYIERIDGHLRKYKLILKDDLKRPLLHYPKLEKTS